MILKYSNFLACGLICLCVNTAISNELESTKDSKEQDVTKPPPRYTIPNTKAV